MIGRSSAAQRSRTIAAAQTRVWAVLDDPHHLPRWWPGVARVEGVENGHWTQVYLTKQGRPVRFDYQQLLVDPPRRVVWEQEVAGTPLARVMAESLTEILLEGDGATTCVTIAQRQKLRGYSRTGGLLMRRGAAARLGEALEGLARILEPTQLN
ncbi:MAG: SRPBCC family protein [Solirubrobacteraceae bacterium]